MEFKRASALPRMFHAWVLIVIEASTTLRRVAVRFMDGLLIPVGKVFVSRPGFELSLQQLSAEPAAHFLLGIVGSALRRQAPLGLTACLTVSCETSGHFAFPQLDKGSFSATARRSAAQQVPCSMRRRRTSRI